MLCNGIPFERVIKMEEMVSDISTVGFPIFSVIAMGYFFYRVWTTQEARNTQREDKLMDIIRDHSTTLANLGRIVDENTKMIAILTEKVESVENKLGENKKL